MTKVTYPIYKIDDRIVFNANGTYTLLDTGFPCSIAVDGQIGPFRVTTREMDFFDDFIRLTAPDGTKVSAILSPMDGYNCHLTKDGITITDEAEPLPEHDFFLPFVDNVLYAMMPVKPAIVNGKMNGTDISFFFDSGARMTMFAEDELAGGKPSTGSYTEWMAMLQRHATVSTYDVALDFPCGLHYEGKGAQVTDREYQMAGRMMGFRAMLGIDVFDSYDLYISTVNSQRGIALIKR